MKRLTLTIILLAFIQAGFGQTRIDISTVIKNMIRLPSVNIEQDSSLIIWPLIVSVADEKNFKNDAIRESFSKYSINFYPELEKGIVYIEFENLPKAIKPDLYFSNSKGEVIYKIRAKTRLNVINFNKVPPGTYLITTDVEEEVSTWEVVKE